MALSPGTRLGPYEILSSLGAGGMGEVYRARDTKLGRDVALKILPDEFAKDPERVARFEREARVLASLNHPHIAQIYGFEAAADKHLLVMELVDGEELAARIRRGPIAVRDAIAIAAQITEALDAAHAQSVIHRDLKPANVKVRGDGTVKLLDFGIAKAFAPAVRDAATVMDTAMTERGAVVGTAAYMSPEQARGQAIDKRTDIWAFGCVVYEMLTARRAFGGDTSTDVVAAVLEREPDWSALPPATPSALRRVLARCLTKDRTRRLADIADAGLELEDARRPQLDASAPVGARVGRWRTAALIALAIAVLSGALGIVAGRRLAPVVPVAATHASILLPPGERFGTTARSVAISADGSQIAYATDRALYVRPIDSFTSRPVMALVERGAVLNPVFSPDGRRIAVLGGLRAVRILDVATGATTTREFGTTDFGGILATLAWDDDGIAVAAGTAGVILLPPNSDPRTLVQLSPGEAAASAQLLPGAESVLLTLIGGTPIEAAATGQIVVQSLETGQRTQVAERGSDARYLSSGHIVYATNGTLFAVPFDVRASRVTGPPAAAVDGVRVANILSGAMHYAVSQNGTLVYIAGQAAASAASLDLTLTSRDGRSEPLDLPPAPYETPRFSPDGQRIAVGTDDGSEASVWIHDLSPSSSIRRLTIGGRSRFPVWSPDSKRVAFQSNREGDLAIYSQAADGSDTPTRLTRPAPATVHLPEDWAGAHLLFSSTEDRRVTLWAYSFADKRVSRFGNVESTSLTSAAFSPDGKWVAYTVRAVTTGLHTVFVQPFPATGAVYQVSRNDDGHHPVWSRNGRELFYVPGPRRLTAVTVTTTPSFAFGPPTALPAPGAMGPGTIARNYDVSPDGTRVVGREVAEDDETRAGAPPRIHLVTNWFEVLRRARN